MRRCSSREAGVDAVFEWGFGFERRGRGLLAVFREPAFEAKVLVFRVGFADAEILRPLFGCADEGKCLFAPAFFYFLYGLHELGFAIEVMAGGRSLGGKDIQVG